MVFFVLTVFYGALATATDPTDFAIYHQRYINNNIELKVNDMNDNPSKNLASGEFRHKTSYDFNDANQIIMKNLLYRCEVCDLRI